MIDGELRALERLTVIGTPHADDAMLVFETPGDASAGAMAALRIRRAISGFRPIDFSIIEMEDAAARYQDVCSGIV